MVAYKSIRSALKRPHGSNDWFRILSDGSVLEYRFQNVSCELFRQPRRIDTVRYTLAHSRNVDTRVYLNGCQRKGEKAVKNGSARTSNAATGNNRLTLTWPLVQTFRCYECKLGPYYHPPHSQIRGAPFYLWNENILADRCSRGENNFPRAAARIIFHAPPFRINRVRLRFGWYRKLSLHGCVHLVDPVSANLPAGILRSLVVT